MLNKRSFKSNNIVSGDLPGFYNQAAVESVKRLLHVSILIIEGNYSNYFIGVNELL